MYTCVRDQRRRSKPIAPPAGAEHPEQLPRREAYEIAFDRCAADPAARNVRLEASRCALTERAAPKPTGWQVKGEVAWKTGPRGL
eukprot:7067979-Alexandrium_andersonii.AAC.1